VRNVKRKFKQKRLINQYQVWVWFWIYHVGIKYFIGVAEPIRILYNFKETLDYQFLWILAVFYIEWRKKYYIFKIWHIIEATKTKKKNSKKLFLHFWRDVFSLLDQNTVFFSKLVYDIKYKNLIKIYSIFIVYMSHF
jgi:hypothetical protein